MADEGTDQQQVNTEDPGSTTFAPKPWLPEKASEDRHPNPTKEQPSRE